MGDVTAQQSLAAGAAALAAGRWEDARTSFEDPVAARDTGEGHFGLAAALWWLGDNHGSVAHCTRAYSLFRRSGETAGAVQCALWLGIVYKANFANFVAANGWISRADRLLESLDQGPLHSQSWVARAYRMADLGAAAELTGRALTVARAANDVDVELTALSQLGLIRVGQGEMAAGFAMIDEAMAAALGGERSTLADMAARHAGAQARSLLSTYFACGDLDELRSLFASAGLRVTATRGHAGTARFPSVDALVATEVESTPLRERISDDVYERIRRGAHEVLAPFTAADGTLEAPFECHVVTASKP